MKIANSYRTIPHNYFEIFPGSFDESLDDGDAENGLDNLPIEKLDTNRKYADKLALNDGRNKSPSPTPGTSAI